MVRSGGHGTFLQRRPGQEKMNAQVVHRFDQHFIEILPAGFQHAAIAQGDVSDRAMAIASFVEPV